MRLSQIRPKARNTLGYSYYRKFLVQLAFIFDTTRFFTAQMREAQNRSWKHCRINMLSIFLSFAGDQNTPDQQNATKWKTYQRLVLRIAFCPVSMDRQFNKRKLKCKQELQNTDKLSIQAINSFCGLYAL